MGLARQTAGRGLRGCQVLQVFLQGMKVCPRYPRSDRLQ